MDEVLFRSSQKFETLQVQLELAANKSKDLLQQYSKDSKSLILQAWHGTKSEQLKQNLKDLYTYFITLVQDVQYRFLYYANPHRIYSNILKFLGAKWTRRDCYCILMGVVIGGIIGIAVGLSIRKKEAILRYMQAIQVRQCLGIESAMVVEDATAPFECGDYDVIVDVKAASVQIIDAHICCGYGRNLCHILRRINNQRMFPLVLGRDCAGIVTDLGCKVKRLEVGDEVWLTVPYWSQGTLCQTVLVPENRVARKPKIIGFEAASSLPYAGSIALNALQESNIDSLMAREKRILVQGGCSPVGCVLIQLLRNWKAKITTTCYKTAVPVAKALGAEDIIVLSDLNDNDETGLNNNHLLKEFESRDVLYDVIINTRPSALNDEQLRGLLKKDGVIVSTLPEKLRSDSYWVLKRLLLAGYVRIGFYLQKLLSLPLYDYDETHLCHISLDTLTDLVEEGHLQTVVHKVFHPHDIEMALNHIQSSQSIGSTIITFR